MTDEFWMNDAEELLVGGLHDGSEEPQNCPHCPCSTVCVGDIGRAYTGRTSFNWNGVVTTQEFTMLQDNDVCTPKESYNGVFTNDTWSQSGSCLGHHFELRVYCRDDNWFFDLITPTCNFGDPSGGVNYATPISNTRGGATLVSASPLHVHGEITTGFYAEDFPFCGKTSSAPIGDFLIDFHFDMTES